jgi:hypothetical protein
MRLLAASACVAVFALLVIGSSDALPSREAAAVVPEIGWHWSDKVEEPPAPALHGFQKLIAQKKVEEQQEWQDEGFYTHTVLTNLPKTAKLQHSKVHSTLVTDMMTLAEKTPFEHDAPKDTMSGLFTKAIKDEEAKKLLVTTASTKLVKEKSSSEESKVKTPPMAHVTKDGAEPASSHPSDRVALEPVHTADKTAKAAHKTTAVKQAKAAAPVEKKAPKDSKLARLDAKEDQIINRELRKHRGKVSPALRVKTVAATSAHSAASDAAMAATKAVGTLSAMKASADALAHSHLPRPPSKAAVQAKIMDEARRSAAKTVARLNKQEAAAQKKKELMQLNALTRAALNSPAEKEVRGVMSKSGEDRIQREIQEAAAAEEEKSVAVQEMVHRAQKHAAKSQGAMPENTGFYAPGPGPFA